MIQLNRSPRLVFRKLLGWALRAMLVAFGTVPAAAQENWVPGHPYLVVETGQRYNRLQDAITDIGAGRGTIRIDPGRWDDCGVQVAGDITYEAAVPGKTFFYGPRVCETKAIFVLRGHSARVTGFVFSDIHTNDGNGAGIRLEHGSLTATQDWFRNSDEGILGDSDAGATVTVDKSSFTHLGRCGGYAPCAHSIYINFYAAVTVTRCRFEAGTGGHYLKSRAARITAVGNAFDDSRGTATNYMIDLSAGATGRIADNWMVQGARKENPSALITVAPESHDHSADGLTIVNNVVKMAPGAKPTVFVADWSGDRLAIGANQLDAGVARYQRR